MIFNVAAPPSVLIVWTIYEYPAEYVAVAHYAVPGLRQVIGQAPPVLGHTLDELRAEFRRHGLTCLGAGGPNDVANNILESWI